METIRIMHSMDYERRFERSAAASSIALCRAFSQIYVRLLVVSYVYSTSHTDVTTT